MQDSNKIIINDDEVQKAAEEFSKNIAWSNGLTKDQINFLCDAGYYNNTIKGYMLKAATAANFTKEQMFELLASLEETFDEINKEEADSFYVNFH